MDDLEEALRSEELDTINYEAQQAFEHDQEIIDSESLDAPEASTSPVARSLDLKLTISRGYTRKINLGNYETMDLFMNASQELLVTDGIDKAVEVSESLFNLCRNEIQKSAQLLIDLNKNGLLTELHAKIKAGQPITIETWLKLTQSEQNILHKAQLAKAAEDRAIAKNNAPLPTTQQRA